MFVAPSSNVTIASGWEPAGSQDGDAALRPHRSPISSGGVLGFGLGHADLDRVVDRVLAPLEPATVIDRDPPPILEIGVEPRLARTPAGAAVEGDPLVGGDAGLGPVGRDLRVRPHRVVDVPVVLHVIGVGAAIAPPS